MNVAASPAPTSRRVAKKFNERVVLHLDHEPPVRALRDELRVLSEAEGRPMGYPLSYGLVLTQMGVRHALRTPDGSIVANRPIWAWQLYIGDDVGEAEARLHADLARYGHGADQWVYPVGKALEQQQDEDLTQLCCCPCLSVRAALRAAVRLGSRKRKQT